MRSEKQRLLTPVNSESYDPQLLSQAASHESHDDPKNAAILREILTGTASFGLRSLFVAAHYIGNGLMMSSLGPSEAAASSVVTTLQTFTIGASSGFLITTGVDLGAALGENNRPAVGAVAKMGWAMSLLLGGFSSAAFLSTRYTLPLILDHSTASAAADFFETFAIAAIPDLLIWTNGQIIFKVEKNSAVPLLASIFYRGGALSLSYFFSCYLGYGAWGLGLGAGVAGWASLGIFQPWFSRKAYRDLNLYKFKIDNFGAEFKNFMSSGWKLSLQRITEWGNLAIITQIAGAWANRNLLAEQPSVLVLTACNLLSQGFGQASMMIASEDCSRIRKYFQLFSENSDDETLEKARKLIDKNYKNSYLSIASVLGFNAALAGSLFLERNKIIAWYVPSNSSEETFKLANTLLWINILSLLPDAIRIILGSLLRGWGDLLFPTLASLIIMSAVGIPLGFGIGLGMNESVVALFVARAISLVLSAAVNYYKLVGHTQDDEIEYDNWKFKSQLLKSFSSYSTKKSLLVSKNSDFYGASLSSVFEIIAQALGTTVERVKNTMAEYIKNNLDSCSPLIKNDKASFLEDLKQDSSWTEEFLFAIAHASFGINIVLVNEKNEGRFLFNSKNPHKFFIKKQANGFYELLTAASEANFSLQIFNFPSENLDGKKIASRSASGFFNRKNERQDRAESTSLFCFSR